MVDFKYSMHCRECGDQFGARRSNAIFCDGACRSKWHKRYNKSKDCLISGQQSRIATKSLRVKTVTCQGCNARFSVNGNNSMRKFHSNACKQKFYRLKKRLLFK